MVCTGTEAGSDIIAADDKVSTVVGATAPEEVDMGMLGVPVRDRDPVERRTKIT
jgi:hypothetical protein